ncbi:MAG: hypothetical protein ACOYM3_24230 [Terrimicrobiaceae bacterium]
MTHYTSQQIIDAIASKIGKNPTIAPGCEKMMQGKKTGFVGAWREASLEFFPGEVILRALPHGHDQVSPPRIRHSEILV